MFHLLTLYIVCTCTCSNIATYMYMYKSDWLKYKTKNICTMYVFLNTTVKHSVKYNSSSHPILLLHLRRNKITAVYYLQLIQKSDDKFWGLNRLINSIHVHCALFMQKSIEEPRVIYIHVHCSSGEKN